MSAAKKDRTLAPRIGSRPSRSKNAHSAKPPATARSAGKPKPGERAMEEQLAARRSVSFCDCGHGYEAHDLDDACSECGCRAWSPVDAPAPREVTSTSGIEGGPPPRAAAVASGPPADATAAMVVHEDAPPPADPWWTDEREKAFAMALQGMPQHQISAELSRDRHTIARWLDDERFAARLYDENMARFKASRQRRSVQTVRLTDKAERLAGKMMDKAIKDAEDGEDDFKTRLAARDWLQEFRENSRREDEIFGLDKQRVDVNVHGQVQHQHKGKVDVSFKTFLATSLSALGVDPEAEEIDAARADEALVAVTERALMEGTFLDDLAASEREQQLAAGRK